jgi:hypothetical protein
LGGRITEASCWIQVDGVDQGKILDATVVGAVAYGAGKATYTASSFDTVGLCTRVTTDTDGAEEECTDLTTRPVCPDAFCGEGGIVDQLGGVLGQGTTAYSTACDGGLEVVDSVVEGVRVKVYVAQPTARETDVCVRAEDATTGQGAGGEFVITPTAPVVLGVPSTDTSSALCTTTKPNAVPSSTRSRRPASSASRSCSTRTPTPRRPGSA